MIYFLAAPKLGLVKVGYSSDVEYRVEQLRSICPPTIKLQLLSVFKGDRSTERAYHKLLAPTRAKGEWFYYDKWMVLAASGLAVPNGDRWKIRRKQLKQMYLPKERVRIDRKKEDEKLSKKPPKEPPGFSEVCFRKNLCEADVGAELRDRRLKLGLTTRVVAERAGISHSHLSKVERGATASEPVLRSIEQVLQQEESRRGEPDDPL